MILMLRAYEHIYIMDIYVCYVCSYAIPFIMFICPMIGALNKIKILLLMSGN